MASEIEPNNSFSSANSLTLGDTARGSLSAPSDWDFYKISVSGSEVLKLNFTPPTLSAGSYCQVDIYDNAGKLLAEDFINSTTSLSLGIPSAGLYYVAITTSAPVSGSQYALSVTKGAGTASGYESENNNTVATANSVALAQTISGQLAGSSDADYYHAVANIAGVLVVDFAAAKTSSNNSFTVDILDATGKLLAEQSTGDATTLTAVVPAAGDYYVSVKQATTYDGSNYSLKVSNDSFSSLATKSFTGTSPLQATLSAGHDWYSVSLVGGSSYEFAVKGSTSGGGTLPDPGLTLCYSTGVMLEKSDNLKIWSNSASPPGPSVTPDPQIAFTAPVTGTYYLMVSGNGAVGSYTLSERIDQQEDLLQNLINLSISPNYRWNGANSLGSAASLTYGFLTATADGETGFAAMSATQKQVVRDILAMYASVARISFSETTSLSNANLRFGTSNQANESSGVTYTSLNGDGGLTQADVFIGNTGSASSQSATSTLTPGGYGYLTLIHEIGHALGLKHPGNYNAGGGGVSPPYMPLAFDSEKFTVMSYLDNADSTLYHSTPGLLDIAALQYMYGANTSAAGSTRSYSFSASSPFVKSLLSSGSSDSIDISNQTLASTILMTPGSLSSIGPDPSGASARNNVSIPYGASLLNVTDGPAADLIVGNVLDNSFFGFSGANTLVGGGGKDTLALSATSSSFNNATDSQFVNVQTITAGSAKVAVSTDAHNQGEMLSLVGGSGNDTIIASGGGASMSGGAGNDSLTGGAGNDIAVYAGNRASFTVSHASTGRYTITDKVGAAGTDTLFNVDVIRYTDGMQNLNIADTAKSITPPELRSLTELYIAYFNRVPEASGLDHWIKQVAAGQTIDQIGAAFYSAATSAEFAGLTGYSNGMDNAGFVTKIYQNVLGRSSPDQEGLNYWVTGLKEGNETRGSLINTILIAAHGFKGDAAYGWVADLLDNKVAVGEYNALTAAVDYLTPQEAVSKGMDIAKLITATDTSAAIKLIGLADQVPFPG